MRIQMKEASSKAGRAWSTATSDRQSRMASAAWKTMITRMTVTATTTVVGRTTPQAPPRTTTTHPAVSATPYENRR